MLQTSEFNKNKKQKATVQKFNKSHRKGAA